MTTLHRRRLLAAAATTLAAPLVNAGTAAAQDNRPIVLVVPYAPGGGTDLTAREFAHGFSEALGGRTVVVENRGGAAGHIGSVSVARSRPDGTQLLFAVSTNLVVNPHTQRGDVDLIQALAPVAQVTSYQYVLVIDPRLPIRTLQELIAYARSKPKGDLTTRPAASATPTTWRACCSRTRRGSRWSTSPIAAPGRRCST
jgi:tripartite-type tricarboxylate transporter receptor subunit TctC